MRAALLVAALALLLVPAAIGGALIARSGGDGAADAGPVVVARDLDTLPAGWRRCTNSRFRYSIGYPGRWHALRRCSLFDPKLMRVPPNTDFYGFALEATVAQDTARNVVRGYVDRRFYRVVTRRGTRVAGHPTTVLEVTATGMGLFARGTHVYAYVVDVRGRPPLLIQTIRRPTRGWSSRKRVVDTAASTLRFLTQ